MGGAGVAVNSICNYFLPINNPKVMFRMAVDISETSEKSLIFSIQHELDVTDSTHIMKKNRSTRMLVIISNTVITLAEFVKHAVIVVQSSINKYQCMTLHYY